jgi:antitoxin component of MazEF toxin-antitoxin module
MSEQDTGKDTVSVQRLGVYSMVVTIPADYVKKNGIAERTKMDAFWEGEKLVYKPVKVEDIKQVTA